MEKHEEAVDVKIIENGNADYIPFWDKVLLSVKEMCVYLGNIYALAGFPFLINMCYNHLMKIQMHTHLLKPCSAADRYGFAGTFYKSMGIAGTGTVKRQRYVPYV